MKIETGPPTKPAPLPVAEREQVLAAFTEALRPRPECGRVIDLHHRQCSVKVKADRLTAEDAGLQGLLASSSQTDPVRAERRRVADELSAVQVEQYALAGEVERLILSLQGLFDETVCRLIQDRGQEERQGLLHCRFRGLKSVYFELAARLTAEARTTLEGQSP